MKREDFLLTFVPSMVLTPSQSSLLKPSAKWYGTKLPSMTLEQAASLIDQNDFSFIMGRWPDPILRQRSSKINSKLFRSSALRSVAMALQRTARVNHAVGLAAQQCGIDASLIYIEVPWSTKGLFLVNPRIVARSPEMNMNVWDERCLVLPPTFHATVLRDAEIIVDYNTLDGDAMTTKFSKELSRAIQHEMDHDRGILILDHIGLDEMDSEYMRQIEMNDHSKRMSMAYSRQIF